MRTNIKFTLYSRTPLIRTTVIRIINCPERLGPSCNNFLPVILLHLFGAEIFLPVVKYIHIRIQLLIFYLQVNKYVTLNSRLKKFFPLRTANVVYFQRKILLSGFAAYPDGSPSQLVRISGLLPYVHYLSSLLQPFKAYWSRDAPTV